MDQDLKAMGRDELVAEVMRLREGIRLHRDAKGHSLCWYHPELWSLLPEWVSPDPEPPPWPEFMQHCAAYRATLDKKTPP